MNFTLLTTAIAAGIASVAGFGLAWRLQAGNISEIELKATNEQLSLQREILKGAEGHATKLAEIQKRSTGRAIQLRSNLSSTVNAGNGLRLTTQNVVRTATQDPAVCSDTATTLGKLFDESSTRYGELAETADRHVIDIQELMERQVQ